MPEIDRFALPKLWPWLDIGPRRGLLLAFVLAALVGLVDYVTGYEERFSILYLLPIGIAAWTGGWPRGILLSLAACLCWFLSFHTGHFYSQDFYYSWEATVMLISFIAFSVLLDSLHAALFRADERFRRLLREIPAGIQVTDAADGTLLYANGQARQLFAGGDPPALATEADGAAGQRFGATEVRDEASGRWYLVQSGLIPWENRHTARLRVVSDITAQKREQALREENRLIVEQAARLSTSAEVASTVAHEINQPLTAIVSYNEACLRLLARPGTDLREIAGIMEKCRNQAMRATDILQRLREFVREQRTTRERCALDEVLREVLDLLRFRIEKAAVAVDLRLPPDLHDIHADKTLLVQVLVNLIQNALEAMEDTPAAERRLAVGARREDNGKIRVSVEDRGSGLSDEALARIGEPFFTTKAQGLGLGLSICRSIVEAHGGRLWAERGAGRGAAFHVTLPGNAQP